MICFFIGILSAEKGQKITIQTARAVPGRIRLLPGRRMAAGEGNFKRRRIPAEFPRIYRAFFCLSTGEALYRVICACICSHTDVPITFRGRPVSRLHIFQKENSENLLLKFLENQNIINLSFPRYKENILRKTENHDYIHMP